MSFDAGGMGWKWRGGSLGAAVMIFPDVEVAVRHWASAALKGKSPTAVQKPEWEEFAKRMMLKPGDTEKGWEILTRVGETVSWSGYSVPNTALVKGLRPGGDGFPFGSREADSVWKAAQDVVKAQPGLSIDATLKAAKGKASVGALSPEDDRIMQLAIHWAHTGRSDTTTPAGNPTRTAGARGSDYGRTLARRGAP